MQRQKEFGGIVFAICTLFLLVTGLGLATRWDLPVSQALYALWQNSKAAYLAGDKAPWYLWGCLSRALAGLPGWGGIAFLGFGLATGFAHLVPETRIKTKVTVFEIGCLLLPIGLCICTVSVLRPLSADNVLNRAAFFKSLFGQLVVGLVLSVTAIILVLFLRFTEQQRQKIALAALLYAGFDLLYVVFSNLIKLIWQRTRFDDLVAAGDSSAFTPWTQLPGNGGSSFPSGHTACAGVLLALVVISRLFAPTRDDEKGYLHLGYGFALFVGFGRILSGRHYISDVLASLLLDSILLAVVWYLPVVRKWMDSVCQPRPDAVPFALMKKPQRPSLSKPKKKVFHAPKG